MVIPSIILKWLFLAPIFAIGIATSCSDIRFGKIKNLHLLLGFSYTLLLYSFLIFYSQFIIHQPQNLKYIGELLINGASAFIVGYLLWYFNLWAAGDAKLLPIYSLLIPLEYYSNNYILYFPSLPLLADTFIFICLALFLKMFVKVVSLGLKYLSQPSWLTLRLSKKTWPKLKKPLLETGKMWLISCGLIIVWQYVFLKINALRTVNQLPLSFIFFFGLQMWLIKKFSNHKLFQKLIFWLGLLSCWGLINAHQTYLLLLTLKLSLLFLLFFNLGTRLVHLYIDKQEISRIKVQHLHSGVFLAEESLAAITRQHPGKIRALSLTASCSDGLTQSQVKTIKALFKADLSRELFIYRTFPFAPFLFLSFIFTIITGNSLLFFLLKL